MNIKVNEIFASIDGEGSRTGYPVTFIRLYDCNLRCDYCDTLYAVEGGDFQEMSITQVMSVVKGLGFKRITLTGGEPLLYPETVHPLIAELLKNNYEVNIETNGAVSLEPFEDLRKVYTRPQQLFYTLDYKSLTSGMNGYMLLDNYKYLRSSDVVKFVVGDEDDLEDMQRVVTEILPKDKGIEIFVSPIFDDIDAADIVDFILNNQLEEVRVQLQLHKFIWDPNMRGV